MNICFKDISRENEEAILKLAVKKSQINFIETVEECLNEAEKIALWKPKGIYIDNHLIGFAMYGLWKEEGSYGRVWLDRFLIDKNYQGNGYAKPVLKALLEKIKNQYGYDEIYLSLYEDNKKAMSIYQKIGFEFNEEVDINGEKIMVIKEELKNISVN